MYKFEPVPLTISGVLKSGWQLYKYAIKDIFYWSLIVAFIHIIPYHFNLVGMYHIDYNNNMSFSWWGVLVFLLLLIPQAFFVAVLFYTLHTLANEQKTDYISAFKIARQQLTTFYFGLLLYTFFIFIGLMLFILPAIFLAVLLCMFIPFIVLEKQGVWLAFMASGRLIWGHWWQTFFVLVVPYLISYLARNFAEFTPWGGGWMLLVDWIILTIVMPYFYSVLLIQYRNLKLIKSLPRPITERPRTETMAK